MMLIKTMDKYKYRVYVDKINIGSEYGRYTKDQYNKAKALFDELVSKGYDAVYLQELNDEFGWVDRDIESHVTDEFKARKSEYWRHKENEDEGANWIAGDEPWNAPGMSISDFI